MDSRLEVSITPNDWAPQDWPNSISYNGVLDNRELTLSGDLKYLKDSRTSLLVGLDLVKSRYAVRRYRRECSECVWSFDDDQQGRLTITTRVEYRYRLAVPTEFTAGVAHDYVRRTYSALERTLSSTYSVVQFSAGITHWVY